MENCCPSSSFITTLTPWQKRGVVLVLECAEIAPRFIFLPEDAPKMTTENSSRYRGHRNCPTYGEPTGSLLPLPPASCAMGFGLGHQHPSSGTTCALHRDAAGRVEVVEGLQSSPVRHLPLPPSLVPLLPVQLEPTELLRGWGQLKISTVQRCVCRIVANPRVHEQLQRLGIDANESSVEEMV